MNTAITDKVIDYVKDGKTSHLDINLSNFSYELQQSLMLLLCWIKIDRSLFGEKTLRIRANQALPQMKSLINGNPDLSFLTIKNGYIKFSPSIGADQVRQIQEYVRNNYRPQFNITFVDEFKDVPESGK